MRSVKIFMQERLPVIPNCILAFGLMFSAFALAGSPFEWKTLIFGSTTLFLFVSELRFMDELKDVEKDMVANPDRPLPRGVISSEKVEGIINLTGVILICFAAASFLFFNQFAGIFLTISILWLFLMFKEFFIGDWLSSRPLLYAISHQIVILPLALFGVALFSPTAALTFEALAFGALILSAFFTFEIGRKLDPSSHPILKTYLVVSGPKKVAFYLALLQMLALLCSVALEAIWWLAFPALLILLTMPTLFSKPEEFKKLEGLIALNLIYSVWVLALKDLAEKFL